MKLCNYNVLLHMKEESKVLLYDVRPNRNEGSQPA